MNYRLYNADVLDYLRSAQQAGDKFHFSFFDPPYEIGNPGDWDESGITFSDGLWQGLYEVLLPGAFVLAYNYPGLPLAKMTVAADDAGFIVHRNIFGWLFSSGYPLGHVKAQRAIEKYINKQYGGECKCEEPEGEEYIGGSFFDPENSMDYPVQICTKCNKPVKIVLDTLKWPSSSGMADLGGPGFGNGNVQVISKPMYKESAALADYAYGKAVLKPALEPLAIFQKPLERGVPYAENVLTHGTGALNVVSGRHTDRWPPNFYVVSEDDFPHDAFDKKFPVFRPDGLEKINFIYAKKVNRKDRSAGLPDGVMNNHSSVKPLSVNRYFAKLFLPPTDIVKHPKALSLFSGTGSEAIGMVSEGWNVVGVELSNQYCDWNWHRMLHHVPNVEGWYFSDD